MREEGLHCFPVRIFAKLTINTSRYRFVFNKPLQTNQIVQMRKFKCLANVHRRQGDAFFSTTKKSTNDASPHINTHAQSYAPTHCE